MSRPESRHSNDSHSEDFAVSCIVRVSFRDDCERQRVGARAGCLFCTAGHPRWPANGTRLHTQRSPGNFQRKRRSLRLGNLLLLCCPPQCRSDNSPPTYASCYGSQPGKLSKIAKGAAAPKLGFASIIWRRRLHWLAAGEPPQYTALVDCRRRWEVRLGLGGGSLGPQIDPRRPEPACDRTIRRRKPSTGITAPATGPPPPQRASCLALLRSLSTAEHCRPATPAQTVENSDSLNCLARRIGRQEGLTGIVLWEKEQIN